MVTKSEYDAVITIQRAMVHPPMFENSQQKSPPRSCVHLQIMVPRGSENVTVPTNCTTSYSNQRNPIWNETFKLPVMPNSDVLVLQLFHIRRSRFKAAASGSTQVVTSFDRTIEDTIADIPYTSASESNATTSIVTDNNDEEEESSRFLGDYIGVSLLPVARIPVDGSVVHQVLELFPQPSEPSIGKLYVAAKIEKRRRKITSKQDLKRIMEGQAIQSSRLLDTKYRFLSIGDLAAFLFSEGHFASVEENWQQAVNMLAQQLSFRINQIKSSYNEEDRASYLESYDDKEVLELARQKIIKDGGLWDGV